MAGGDRPCRCQTQADKRDVKVGNPEEGRVAASAETPSNYGLKVVSESVSSGSGYPRRPHSNHCANRPVEGGTPRARI